MQKSKTHSKRILKVTIKRMYDESPDTSWLGEYSDKPKSDYAIDRAHDEDCIRFFSESNNADEARDILSSIWTHINSGDCADQSELQDGALLPEEKSAIQTIDDLLASFDCSCIGNDWNRREYRYFNPCHENYKGLEPAEIREYCLQDYARMESLNRGDFCFIGIRAEAQVQLTGDLVQRISSGGLWGIESDSDSAYMDSVEREELSALKTELLALGFSKRAIAVAFKSIEREEL